MGDDPIVQTWLARHELGRHDENVEMLEALVASDSGDASLRLLLSASLVGSGRGRDAVHHVDAAVDLAPDDPSVLTRAASHYFMFGWVDRASECAARAAKLAPRDFIFSNDLRQLRRDIRRRRRNFDKERALRAEFENDPGQPRVAKKYARLLARQGRRYAAYGVIYRALQKSPAEPALIKLHDELAHDVPADVRRDLEVEARAAV